MITRREAVLGLSAAAIASAAPSAFGLRGLLTPVLPEIDSAGQSEDQANSSVDQRLSKALALMASRANSEEGVPVFLACVNQAGHKNTKSVPLAKPTPLSTAVAAEMRDNAAAWQRIRHNPPASDVAQLIEVLAERDFLVGGTEHKS